MELTPIGAASGLADASNLLSTCAGDLGEGCGRGGGLATSPSSPHSSWSPSAGSLAANTSSTPPAGPSFGVVRTPVPAQPAPLGIPCAAAVAVPPGGLPA